MTKFTTPVSMVCTPEQFERDLRNQITDLGYKINSIASYKTEHLSILCKTSLDRHGLNPAATCDVKDLGDFPNDPYPYHLYDLSGYNPELFLALAAMTDEEYGIAGEWWTCRKTYKSVTGYCLIQFTENKMYKAIKAIDSGPYFIDDLGYKNGFENTFTSNKHFRKATKEELIAHFTKEEKQEPEWEPKNGELVEWRYNSTSFWNHSLYVGLLEGKRIVGDMTQGGLEMYIADEIRQIKPKQKVTLNEIEYQNENAL